MVKTMQEINLVIQEGPYQDTWESLQTKPAPSWFGSLKFGIFIHFGLYSIPAFNNEWYSRNMYIEGTEEFEHHKNTYGPHKEFGYKDFIPVFTIPKFHPDEWAKIIKSSHAKYVFPVAEHHEGFQMYKSDISKWNAYDMGPKRDILGELKQSFEQEGLVFCTSSHRAEHWFFMNGGTKFDSDITPNMKKGDFYWPAMEEQHPYDFSSTPTPSKEFLEDWLIRTVELIDNYQPKLLYFDWWIQHEAFTPYLKKIAAYYYNVAQDWDMDVMITYKHDAMMFGSGIVEVERGKFASVKHFPWQTDTAIANNSWCYTDTLDYKTANEVLVYLIDVVSKNGNLLLNIGPKGDGSIPEYEIQLLQDIGKWLDINQEAIFESKPYLVYGEGPAEEVEGKFSDKKVDYASNDFRFTINNGAIYAICLNPEGTRSFSIQSMKQATEDNPTGLFRKIENVVLLGSKHPLTYNQDKAALHIKIKSQYVQPIVFKITLH